MKIKWTLLSLVCLSALLLTYAMTPKYPNRPVVFVIPFSAGNAGDIFTRQYAGIVSKHFGQSIQCINMSGKHTSEAVTYVYDQQPDGYTVILVTPSLLISELQILRQIEQTRARGSIPLITDAIIFRNEFEPLLRVQADIQLFGVSPNGRFKSIDEILSYAKEHPGEITIGGISPMGLDEYLARGFAKAAGIELTYIPYASSEQALEALLDGSLDVYQDKMIRFLPLSQSGRVKPVVVLHDEQVNVQGLKDCPASAEIGIPFTHGSWRGFAVKKGTPQEIKDKLILALNEAYKDPEYTALSEKYLTNIRAGYLEADTWRSEWDQEYETLTEVFK